MPNDFDLSVLSTRPDDTHQTFHLPAKRSQVETGLKTLLKSEAQTIGSRLSSRYHHFVFGDKFPATFVNQLGETIGGKIDDTISRDTIASSSATTGRNTTVLSHVSGDMDREVKSLAFEVKYDIETADIGSEEIQTASTKGYTFLAHHDGTKWVCDVY